MRSIQLILIIPFLYLFLAVASASALPARNLLRRQDDPPQSSSAGPAPASSGGNNFPALTTTTTPAPSSTNAPSSQSQTGSAAMAAVNSTATSITASASAPTSASPTTSVDPSSDDAPLPLAPQLSAAMAVAGVILLASGIIYTFIGIKSRVIQVFISTAYLISLGITVLIVYVMTPPLSAGTEGAYLAAVVLPGLILGAGAVVFKDVTEGLGCAVGGFALGMWFLTIKPGGLVDSEAGKIVLLCCFTAISFSLSFSRYTRTWGLIGSTAFAGATAMVLGIDCFAKTGLKEFWLYIWNLNNNLFPLDTHTYPLTKNLKAEIAGIVVITLFGVLSQIQVWKIVQKKRAKRAEVEEKEAREKQDEEARLGKDLEARNQAEKMIWERTYADHPRDIHSDSGIGSDHSSSEKGSTRNSISEKGKGSATVEAADVDDMASARHSKAARRLTPHIIVSVAEEEEDELSSSPRSPMAQSPKLPPLDFDWGQKEGEQDEPEDPASSTVKETDPAIVESLKGKSLKPKTVPTPVVVPLPFSIPTSRETPNDDDASSVATAATTAKRASKRFSTNSLFEKMTKGRLSYHARGRSDATSVQAVADSPTREQFDSSSIVAFREASAEGIREDAGSIVSPEHDTKPSSPRSDYFTVKRIVGSESGLLSPTLPKSSPRLEGGSSSEDESVQAKSVEPSEKLASPVLNLDSIKASASGTSKVMNAFRTNEWAKHLEGAQNPEEDDIPTSEPPSPSFPADPISEEMSAEEKVETVPISAPSSEGSSGPPSPTTATQPQLEEPAPKASWPKPSSRRRTSAAITQSTDTRQAPQINRQASRDARSSTRMSGLRSSSGSRTRGGKARQPAQQQLVTSPIREDEEAFFPAPARRRSSLNIQPDSLLAQREAMVSQSSIVRSASQASQYNQVTGPSASWSSLTQSQIRPGSVLSRRSSTPESFVLPQRQPSAASMRASGQPYSPPPPVRTYSPNTMVSPITHATASPPPDRALHHKTSAIDDERRTSMLTQWHASLAGEQQQRRASQMQVDVETARAGQGWMDMQRQQREYERQKQQAVGWGTERTMSPVAVANSSMQNQMAAHEAHREILRRMQSKSKVKA